MAETDDRRSSIVDLDVDLLSSPSWLLRPLDYAFVAELARSIEGTGLLQPIVVRKCRFGFEVVFGNHRLEACKNLGMKKIRVMVMPFTEEEAFLARVSENLLRNASINPIEEAKGYSRLLKNGWTINGIGTKIGKSDSYVCERLSIIDRLDRNILDKVSYGSHYLTTTHLELLSKVKDVAKQRELSELVEKKRLSARTLENIINGTPAPKTIIVDDQSGECAIRIPREFVKAIGMKVGQSIRLRVRGKKLVLENAELHRRKGFKRELPPYSSQRRDAPVHDLRA